MTLIDGKNKLILLMKYQEDTSIVEIKGALNSSESAFKTHVKRAKKKLLVFTENYKLDLDFSFLSIFDKKILLF
jgi:RNA polymerase sigma-70 factor (ECF subfamily)|tara:strand:- start:1556 stop:1777 length:222 start_codon:yes stop_codon:yes gene_type:complete